jgi:hypothetical protein
MRNLSLIKSITGKVQNNPTGYATNALISVNCNTATKMALALYVHHDIATAANEYPRNPLSMSIQQKIELLER